MKELRINVVLVTQDSFPNDSIMKNLVRLVIGETILQQLDFFKNGLKELKISGVTFGGFPHKFADAFPKLVSVCLENIHIKKSVHEETFVNMPECSTISN